MRTIQTQHTIPFIGALYKTLMDHHDAAVKCHVFDEGLPETKFDLDLGFMLLKDVCVVSSVGTTGATTFYQGRPVDQGEIQFTVIQYVEHGLL